MNPVYIFLQKIIKACCLLALALLFCHLLPGPSVLAVDSGQEEPFATGFKELSEEEWEELKPRIFKITEPLDPQAAENLPSSVKNTKYLPAVRSQGYLGICSDFAVAYYLKTYQKAREQEWTNPDPAINPERVASPGYYYALIGHVGSLKTAQFICDHGIATWEDMPYELPLDRSFVPTTDQWKKFASWRGDQAGVIKHDTPEGILALKEHLAGGDIAVMATVPIYKNIGSYPSGPYIDNQVLYNPCGEVYDLRGHAFTLIGYDDEREYYDKVAEEYKQGAFLFVNSWGRHWGLEEPDLGEGTDLGTKGFIWIAYDYFLEGKSENDRAVIMSSRKDYQPHRFALVGLEHSNGKALIDNHISLFELNQDPGRDEVSYYQPVYPHSDRNNYAISSADKEPIAVDISAFPDHQLAYNLEITQLHEFGGRGEINYLAIQDGDNDPVPWSTDVPVAIDNDENRQIHTPRALQAKNFNDSGVDFSGLNIKDGAQAWADFSGNGFPDLLLSGWDQGEGAIGAGERFTGIFVNRGNASFSRPAGEGLPQLRNSQVAVADYNNNGRPDVAISGSARDPESGHSISQSGIYRNDGALEFALIDVELPAGIRALHWVDINNNGRSDLVVQTTREVVVFENLGNDNFEPMEPLFNAADFEDEEVLGEGHLRVAMAWGDYDGDGLVDLAVVGEYYRGTYREHTRVPLSAIFKNRGSGVFEDTGTDLPVLLGASAAWGDFTKNGLLDLAITGYLDRATENMEGMTVVYQNDGHDNFSAINADLGQAWHGRLDWGDLNNNGWLDLIVTGQNAYMLDNRERFYPDDPTLDPFPEWKYYDNQTRVFLNDQQGSLVRTNAGLPRVSNVLDGLNNTVGLVDYNLNNSLDLFLSGTKTRVGETLPEYIETGLYRNDLGDSDSGVNTPPAPPQDLAAQDGKEPGAVSLSWEPGLDTETPGEGLYYNLRVGTTPGAANVVSEINAAVTPGRQLITGNLFSLRELPAGTYYWSVQTLDAGYAASNWSDEATFTIEEGSDSAFIPEEPHEPVDPYDPGDPDEKNRLAGSNRYETAIAISQDSFPEPESADAVAIARCDQFADALPGGVLAYNKNGPLLLTRSDNLREEVADEINRVLTNEGTIYILGGTNAISEAVESKLDALGDYQVKRLAGSGRYETAVMIAEEVGASSGKAVVAYARNFPDALAVSSYAARAGMPILLSGTDSLHQDTADYFNEHTPGKIYVIGGEAVISPAVMAELKQMVGVDKVKRLGGANRYETAELIAAEFHPLAQSAFFASGGNFPDALAGGVNAAGYNAPILLVRSEQIPEEIKRYLFHRNHTLEEITVYGGPAAVGNRVRDRALEMITAVEDDDLLAIEDYYPQEGPSGAHVYLLLERPVSVIPGSVEAFYDGVAVETTIIEDKMIELVVPLEAASGEIELKAGDYTSPSLPFTVEEPAMTPLAEETMQPTDQKQSLSYNDEITVTLPPDLLSESRTLSISRVEGAPPSDLMPFSETQVYDVTVQGQEEFDDFIEIAIRYDPEMVDEARAVEEQLVPMRWDETEEEWLPLPYYVDSDAGLIYIYSDHLSLVKLLALYNYYVASWVADLLEIGYDSYVTESETGSFRLIYKRDFFEQQSTILYWDMFRPSLSDKFFYHPDHPDYIQDIGYLFELAYKNYQEAGLKPVPTTRTVWYRPWAEEVRDPINIKIDSKWIRTVGEPHYEKIFRKLHFNALDLALYDRSGNISYVAIGHELFHRVQHEYYSRWGMRQFVSANFWWIEATAEYAGANVAWAGARDDGDDDGDDDGETLRFDENLRDRVRPDFLSHALTTTGKPEGWRREYEYLAANFVKYLVEVKELNFVSMIEAVAEGAPFPSLDEYILRFAADKDDWDTLQHPGGGLAAFYHQFARWTLFSDDSFLRNQRGHLYPLVDFSRQEKTRNEVAVQKDVLHFNADDGIEVEISGGDTSVLDIYVLPEGERAGSGEPDQTHRLNYMELTDGDKQEFDQYEAGDIIYFLAVNYGEADDQVTVTMKPVIQNGEGDNSSDEERQSLVYTFDLAGDYSAQLWAVKVPEVQIEFTKPFSDQELQVDSDGNTVVEGRILTEKFANYDEQTEDIQLYRYTRNNDMQEVPGEEVIESVIDHVRPTKIPVEVERWAMEADGSFTVQCNIPDAEKVYALLAVVKLRGEEEVAGAVKLGSPSKMVGQHSGSGETIDWSIAGLPRLFYYDGSLSYKRDPASGGLLYNIFYYYHYELPPGKEMGPEQVTIEASVNANLWESGFLYMLDVNRWSTDGDDKSTGDTFNWLDGMEDTHDSLFEASLKEEAYRYHDHYQISYNVFNRGADNPYDQISVNVVIHSFPYYSVGQIVSAYNQDREQEQLEEAREE